MYKVIEEYPRWEINEEGHIRNVVSKVDKFVYINKQGYVGVNFKKDGKQHSKKVHRYVGKYFLPEPSEELTKLCESKWPYVVCINHIDHNKTNNKVENLEWCDIRHNNHEAIKAGVVPPLKGTLNGRSKLTEELVHKVCKAFEEGMKPKDAVTEFGISRQQATKIRAGYAWKHIWVHYDIEVNRRK